MNIYDEYRSKLRTPDEAVKVVKSGDWVDYTSNLGFPALLDEALARRRDELTDVKIRGNLMFGPVKAAECDPSRTHFMYNSWHFSAYERSLSDRGLCNFIPMIFRQVVEYYKHFLTVNVAMMCVTPMDEHGYFNLSCATGVARGILEKADLVIVEVNENLPRILGGFDETIHISEVDYVVEGAHAPLHELPAGTPSKEDLLIADHIIPYIPSGATLQLGIGNMPNIIGKRLAESDLKDLGMHTELCGDAYYELFRAGRLTNRNIQMHRGKGAAGMVFGSKTLYEWVNNNPGIMACPLSYINDPYIIGQIDNMISINNCIAVDLYGQICAESVGQQQISGTGGQLDFLTGASISRGGKSFICMTSSFTDRSGNRKSNIVPHFSGDIITDPRSQAYFIVTEYGVVNLVGLTTWERAERLISIAHPQFRDELIREADRQNIWVRSNKR